MSMSLSLRHWISMHPLPIVADSDIYTAYIILKSYHEHHPFAVYYLYIPLSFRGFLRGVFLSPNTVFEIFGPFGVNRAHFCLLHRPLLLAPAPAVAPGHSAQWVPSTPTIHPRRCPPALLVSSCQPVQTARNKRFARSLAFGFCSILARSHGRYWLQLKHRPGCHLTS